MIDKNIFRQYDIRGVVNKQLTKENTKIIAYHLGIQIQKKSCKNAYIVVGYDVRKHSKMLFKALVSGLNASGCRVLNCGLVATGVNYFASFQSFKIKKQKIKPNASIMITGSHNAKKYNGFKITVNNEPFFADDLIKVYKQIKKNPDIKIKKNLSHEKINARKLYIDYMIKQFSHLQGFKEKFAIDCGNGVANTVICKILDKLDLKYKALNTIPDGNFPNHHPDPSKEKNLASLKKLLKDDINLGFAYDGDADRIAVLTQKHNIKGDTLAYLFSTTMKNPVIIGEVTYSQNIFDEINNHGKTVMDKTGYSNLRLKLKELNADLAAEVSGHIFFNDRYYGYDDAIYATLRVLELVFKGINLDKQIAKLPSVYTSPNIEMFISEDIKFALIKKLKQEIKKPQRGFPVIKEVIKIDGIRIVFEYGWALVRASNTEPKLVTKYEATSHATAISYQMAVENLIKKVLNELNSTSS